MSSTEGPCFFCGLALWNISGIPSGRLSWLEVEVAPKKGFRLFQNLDLGCLVAEAMAFVVEQPNLHRDPTAVEGIGHALGLFRRHHLVLQALEKQHGAGDLLGVKQG